MRNFYLLMAVIGTVGPCFFFATFLSQNGPDLPAFLSGMFANGAAGGISTDLILSSAVFWNWSRGDALCKGVAHWWILVPATVFVGLSLALPLYLWMRKAAVRSMPAGARSA